MSYGITGYSPIDESAILLQRLPYLGRVGSGSSDRIFIDPYAKDGLRGLSLSEAFGASDKRVARTKWLQPLGEFGVRVLAKRITAGNEAEKYVRLCINSGNSQVACDYIILKTVTSGARCSFVGLDIIEGNISSLAFVEKEVVGLHLYAIDIEELTIEASTFENCSFEHCSITTVKGVGGADKLPTVFAECLFGSFQAAITISRISELNLHDNYKTLLALIKKLFFQPGGGRQEEALLRGAETYWVSNVAEDVLRYMQSNNIIGKVRGDHGSVFIPRRRHTQRMALIWELQSSCNDVLWTEVAAPK